MTVTTEGTPPEARRRKLFVLAGEIGLDRDQRLAFAEYLLRRDIISWRHLDDEQVVRVLDGLEGYQLISELKRQMVYADPTNNDSTTSAQS